MSERYYNTLEITGDEAQVEAIKEFIRGTQDELGKEVYFDFNKVIKMPDELKNEDEKLFSKDSKTYTEEELMLDEHKEFFETQQECIGKYDIWCYNNWQTKYEAFDQKMEDDSIINYTTIDSPGLIVIKKLSQLFSENIFIFTSLCESPDDHIYHFRNGEILLFCDCDYFVQTILNNKKNNKSISKSENKIIESIIKNENGYYIK
jgi:hypothetical protein